MTQLFLFQYVEKRSVQVRVDMLKKWYILGPISILWWMTYSVVFIIFTKLKLQANTDVGLLQVTQLILQVSWTFSFVWMDFLQWAPIALKRLLTNTHTIDREVGLPVGQPIVICGRADIDTNILACHTRYHQLWRKSSVNLPEASWEYKINIVYAML